MKHYTVIFNRSLRKKPVRRMLRQQIMDICEGIINQKMYRFWSIKLWDNSVSVIRDGRYWVANYKIAFFRKGGHKSAEPKQWKQIYKKLLSRSQNKKPPWTIECKDAPKETSTSGSSPTRVQIVTGDVKDYAKVELDIGNHFDHIFDRESQILRIRQSIELATMTHFQKRQHCVLWGPPGCAKTEIILSLGKMLGAENDAWMRFDATTTTQAGAIHILLNSPHIPPVLLVEEIEKTDLKDMRWMLGLLDQRAEIRQTNFRVGNRARNVKMLCIATVNDMNLFKSAMSGALASRFSNQIYCPYPSQETMEKVLKREITAIGGKPDWVKCVLEMGREFGIQDPRELVNICLCGRDSLLDGTYQNAYKDTMPPKPKPMKA